MPAARSTRCLISGFGEFLEAEPEGHVLEDGHVRIERVVLERHGDVAILGREIVDDLAADHDLARGRLPEPGDHAQGGAFAAARRAHQFGLKGRCSTTELRP